MLKQIKIDGIEQRDTQYGKKITFLSEKEKYIFFDTKKDGEFTKAYNQFKRFRFQVGDVVSAEVEEEPKSFNDPKTGKQVNYTQRLIKYFQVIDEIPVVETPKAPSLPQNRPVAGFQPKTEQYNDPDIFLLLGQINAKIDGLPLRIEKMLDDRMNEGKNPF